VVTVLQLQDYIDPYKLKRFLIAVIIITAAIVIALFVSLILHKIYIEFRSRQLRRLREEYIEAISARFAEPGSALKRPEGRLQYQAAGDVLIDMLTSMTGEVGEKVKRIARELGIDEYYRELAVSGSWVSRLIAIEKLGFLHLPEMKDFFVSVIARTDDVEILARAVLGLSFIASDVEDINVINGILNNPLFRSSKFNEYVYTSIISSFTKKGISDRFVDFLDSLREDQNISVMLKRDIIEACGSENFYLAKAAILDYYNVFQDTPEMRITCIRSLGRLGGDDVCKIIDRCLSDGDWRVRAVSAKNAHLCSEDIIEKLRESLRDENYYVRINSAITLSKLGEKGLSALGEEVDSNDRFTRDVSRYILKEVQFRA
jgi:hypothetical protein